MARRRQTSQFRNDQQGVWAAQPPVILDLFPTGAIAAGDWVSIDFAVTTNGVMQHCKQAPVSDQGVCGVALDAASGASTTGSIRVLVEGIYSTDNGVTQANTANVVSGVALGDDLMVSTATAGRAAKFTSATVTAYPIGSALSVATGGNQAGVYVRNPMNL